MSLREGIAWILVCVEGLLAFILMIERDYFYLQNKILTREHYEQFQDK